MVGRIFGGNTGAICSRGQITYGVIVVKGGGRVLLQ